MRLMIRVLICDDDDSLLDEISSMTYEILNSLSVNSKIHSYSFPETIGIPILASCDIALLDIDFGGGHRTGLDVARKLREHRPDSVIIFITNYIEYAPEGYELNAFRYILKKDLRNKLADYLALSIEHLAKNRKTLKFKTYGEIIDLKLCDILFLESQLRMVVVHMKRNSTGSTERVHSYYATMTDLELELEPLGFLRIHKSYLVNMQYIKRFQNKEVLLIDGTTLRVVRKTIPRRRINIYCGRGVHKWNTSLAHFGSFSKYSVAQYLLVHFPNHEESVTQAF